MGGRKLVMVSGPGEKPKKKGLPGGRQQTSRVIWPAGNVREKKIA